MHLDDDLNMWDDHPCKYVFGLEVASVSGASPGNRTQVWRWQHICQGHVGSWRHESARLSLDTLMVAGSIHPDKKLAEYLSLDTGVAMAIILVTTGPESSGCTV